MVQVESEDKCCGSPSAIYYRGKNISRSVNTDKSYYLRLCLLKVMSPNEQDTAIRLGGGGWGGFRVAPIIYETCRVDKLISFLLISFHMNSMPTANSEAVW